MTSVTDRLGRIIQAAAHMQRPEWEFFMGNVPDCEEVKHNKRVARIRTTSLIASPVDKNGMISKKNQL